LLLFFCLDTKEPKNQVGPRYAFFAARGLGCKASQHHRRFSVCACAAVLCLLAMQTLKGLLPSRSGPPSAARLSPKSWGLTVGERKKKKEDNQEARTKSQGTLPPRHCFVPRNDVWVKYKAFYNF
jgi:hypothetical protein